MESSFGTSPWTRGFRVEFVSRAGTDAAARLASPARTRRNNLNIRYGGGAAAGDDTAVGRTIVMIFSGKGLWVYEEKTGHPFYTAATTVR
jgi:hypothetical protein